jgi:hypothetical protein
MWTGIFIVAVVMTVGTLLVLDASLPGGLINGTGSMRYAQTMAFTTLTLSSCSMSSTRAPMSEARFVASLPTTGYGWRLAYRCRGIALGNPLPFA